MIELIGFFPMKVLLKKFMHASLECEHCAISEQTSCASSDLKDGWLWRGYGPQPLAPLLLCGCL